MNKEELTRKLNSVGKQAFVEHFCLFQKYSSGSISRDRAINELVNLGVSNESGAAIRVGNAKLIFESQKEMDALSIVIDSKRLPFTIIEFAKKLKR